MLRINVQIHTNIRRPILKRMVIFINCDSFPTSLNSEILFAINDSHDIVGIANYSGSNREKINHVARMAISVEKSYWSSDVSMSLMTELIKNARENGIEILTLEVFDSNQRAINFYKKFGFEKIGYFKHFSKINGEYEDAMLMNLYIKS